MTATDYANCSSPPFGVTYYRYGEKLTEWLESIEDCIAFLYWGSDLNQLCYTDSTIVDQQNNLIRSAEEVEVLISTYNEKEST